MQSGEGRQFDYAFASGLVDVGLDASCSAAEKELCVAVIAVVCLSRQPASEVVTIAKQKSARVSGTFECAVAGGVFCEKFHALDANL